MYFTELYKKDRKTGFIEGAEQQIVRYGAMMKVDINISMAVIFRSAIVSVLLLSGIAAASITTFQYKAYLDTLGKTSASSILMAKDTLISEFANASTTTSDDALRFFYDYYTETIRELDHAFYKRRDLQVALHDLAYNAKVKLSDPAPLATIRGKLSTLPSNLVLEHKEAIKELGQLEEAGISFTQGEGDWYLMPASDFLLSVVTLFKGDYAEYLSFVAVENKERLAEDAGLIVAWDTIRKRIVRWEVFAQKHPELPETKTAIDKTLNGLVGTYLYGLDNTPVNNKNYEAIESFRRYLSENKDSRFYEKVKKRYDALVSSKPK